MATVPGIDVSYWDSEIDWSQVQSSGVRFAFIKATEGETYTDPTFATNWAGAKSVGILRGAYCFFHPNVDAIKQADLFIQTVKARNDNGELPPVLDLEAHDQQSNAVIISKAKTWLDRVEQAFGKKPIIYSGYYFLKDHFSEASGEPPAWVKDYPLWIAQYPGTYTPGMQPALPKGWLNWAFWQYSETGQVKGIKTNVDLNFFNGSLDDLYRFAGLGQPPAAMTYTVKAGDTLEAIAARFGLSLSALLAANPQLLKEGIVLTVPASSGNIRPDSGSSQPVTSTPASATPRTYTVQPGDNLTIIASKFGTTVAAIAQANNLTNINQISVGQILKIP
ncbi:MAG: GH25 family lysozyme [Anaerolineae bacterium]